ncbi:MAG: 16S rRNA (adenine(1518)-N(6)/adenine(1519)-N(6))-dimethyltransferase RsmA [Holosporaceae bacterium]|jgi:16S rRNA (adenine1518-N6/adenine1519-N6)-dimethyltransferase|nr:16S rRNA (adenine(1518)-N(6)/adenine(1519)-N(6))-dimethyltransferase RsmA [Holosporaceae bacterium]
MNDLTKFPEKISARKIFSEFPQKTKKKFGQHFLFDERVNRRIVEEGGDLTDKVVVEVGPGTGGLTLEILGQSIKKLYVVEIDPHWSTVWKDLSTYFEGRLEVVEQNALDFDFQSIQPQILIANLPYNISTALLRKWIMDAHSYERLILMFQKEVADRLCARPSTKAYGRLSVLTQWRLRVKKAFDIEPGSFFPPPRVKSSVLTLMPYPEEQLMVNFYPFSELLTIAFSHRRKSVLKSLTVAFPDAKQILQSLGYNSSVRAENISVTDYVKFLSIASRGGL